MTREGEEGAGEVSCIPDADDVSVVVLWQRVCGCMEAGGGGGHVHRCSGRCAWWHMA